MAANTSTTTSSSGGMDKRLLQAAISGDSTSMKEMALQDPSILLGTTIAGNTCLHISTVHGHEGFCKDVLELEQSLIKVVNLDGETSITYQRSEKWSHLFGFFCIRSTLLCARIEAGKSCIKTSMDSMHCTMPYATATRILRWS